MEITELAVPDAFVLTPVQHRDERGVFLESYRHEALTEAVGHPLRLAQGNTSFSAKGVVRGIHYADVPPSQAKYVTCAHGAVMDIVVDLRVGSPTFGRWDAVRLDASDRASVYVSEGLGHAFVALSESATVMYLCSEVYSPQRERAISPLDAQLAIDFAGMLNGDEMILSSRDAAAPSLADAIAAGTLPQYADCLALYSELSLGAGSTA